MDWGCDISSPSELLVQIFRQECDNGIFCALLGREENMGTSSLTTCLDLIPYITCHGLAVFIHLHCRQPLIHIHIPPLPLHHWTRFWRRGIR